MCLNKVEANDEPPKTFKSLKVGDCLYKNSKRALFRIAKQASLLIRNASLQPKYDLKQQFYYPYSRFCYSHPSIFL